MIKEILNKVKKAWKYFILYKKPILGVIIGIVIIFCCFVIDFSSLFINSNHQYESIVNDRAKLITDTTRNLDERKLELEVLKVQIDDNNKKNEITYKNDEAKYKNFQIFAGIGGVILLIVQIIRTFKFSQQVNEERRSNLSQQLLEQYGRAVDQLKDENNIAVRLGGIYSLERIMNSEEKESDEYHKLIIELLCAYVREKRKINKDEIRNVLPIESDIRAILTVLGKRTIKTKNRDLIIDLNNTNLYGAQLKNTIFHLACFSGAILMHINFENSDLSNSDFIFADLRYSNLKNANLNNTFLLGADLSHSNLRGIKNIAENRKYTDDELRYIIIELSQAKSINKIKLDKRIMEIIRNEFPEMIERIEREEGSIHY